MKKLFTILFILNTFFSTAQKGLFIGHNTFVASLAPPTITTGGLILYLDANNATSYSGSGTTWNGLSGQNNTATLVGSPTLSYGPASFTLGPERNYTTTKSNISLMMATFNVQKGSFGL